MRNKHALWIIMGITAALLLTSCRKEEPKAPSGGIKTVPPVPSEMTTPKEAAAPAFSLIDQEGKTHSLADCAGKVVVLEWTNPECPYVQFHYAPEQRTMVKLAEKYQPQGVIWLAIDSTNFHDQAGIKKWHDTQKLPYPVLDDHDGVVGKAYKAKTTPHVFVIDKQGRIAYQGAIDDDSGRKGEAKINYVAQALDAVLAGKAPETAETPPYGCSVKYKP